VVAARITPAPEAAVIAAQARRVVVPCCVARTITPGRSVTTVSSVAPEACAKTTSPAATACSATTSSRPVPAAVGMRVRLTLALKATPPTLGRTVTVPVVVPAVKVATYLPPPRWVATGSIVPRSGAPKVTAAPPDVTSFP
jgi:hypothetical protein